MNKNKFDYKNLTPFKWFVLENFPFIEADFDALTEWQLFCKLGKEINKIIDSQNVVGTQMENVTNAFIELQNYVNNYFENLDVQDEINNKLNEMTENGTLENLIGAYIQPRIDAQNERINQIDNKVNSATSSAPLVASSTSGMTDTNRIYVNTTDGYWYYYNGSNWVQGGVYQGVNLSNKGVHYENLDDELQDSIESVNNPTNITSTNRGLVNVNGSIKTSNIIQYYEFSVQPFDVYKLHIRYDASKFSDNQVAIQYLNNDTVISNLLKTDVEIDENNYYTKIITIPYGVNKIRINTLYFTTQPSFLGNYILKVKEYEINNIKKYQLDSTLQSFFQNEYEQITPTVFCPQSYFNLYTFKEYAGTEILSVSVKPHEVYRITAVQVDANPLIGFLTNNAITTKELNGNTYNLNNYVDFIKDDENRHIFKNYVFEIPEYCDKIYINHWTDSNDTIFKLEKCTSYKINKTDIIDDNKIGFNKLIAIGDSITEVNYRALHNYLYWIKQDIPSLTIQNLGVSGTGYMRTSNTFINRINSINSYDLENDVIMVMGSVNDMSFVQNQLGQLGDTTTDTLYGSMYQFFNTLFTKFNGVRVGCISPINWRYSGNEKQSLTLYIKALKETCELFNVPFLDIHDKTNLRPENDTFRNTYYLADGTGNKGQIDSSGIHPNSEGHKLLYGRIKDFVSKL